MTSASVEMPHIEVFQRVLELPMVELALSTTASTYSRLKDSNRLVTWVLTCVETSLGNASRQAAPFAKPFEPSIAFVDSTLCRGLDQIERKVPIVKDKPELILEKSYMLALETVRPAVSTISYANDYVSSRAASIKDISWNKMNQILSTEYGTAAVVGLDNTVFLVEMLIDKYFPPMGEENFQESVSMQEDRLLHTLQSVGRLSNKATRRVYAHVSHQLRTLSKDNLKTYLHSLVEFLQLARYARLLGERSAAVPPPGSVLASSSPVPARSTGNGSIVVPAPPPPTPTGKHEQHRRQNRQDESSAGERQ